MSHSKKLALLLSFMITGFLIASCEEELFNDIVVRERLDSLITEVVTPGDTVSSKIDSLTTDPDSVTADPDSVTTDPDSVVTEVDSVAIDPIDPAPTTPEPAPPVTSSNIIYQETVEGPEPFSTAHDWDVGSWSYALQFVNSPAFKGNRSARFEIQEDQELVATGKRSEVTIIKGAEEGMAKEMWYSFAVYFPSNGYEYDDEREVINQWYQSGSPATSLRTQKDRILLESGNTPETRVKHDVGAITKDRWHTFVMHFVHSYGSDGLIELWHNGTKKLTIKGGNMYDNVLPKWKIGLYKSAFKYGTSDVTRRVIFFDNVKVGNAQSTYATMDPSL